MIGAADISWTALLLALLFVGVSGIVSLRLHLGLERDLLWGTLRTVSQLMLMGFVLRVIFAWNTWYVVLALFATMIFFASRIVRDRVGSRSVSYGTEVFVSMLLCYMVVCYFVVAVIIGAHPWYDARIYIPIGGMIIGNSMSAIAIALKHLFDDLRDKRNLVELRLCVGADYREASQPMFRDAIRAGMIPSINAMMGVGLVTIPGMMTGQILANTDPVVAVKYQIVVMLMLVASTAVGSVLTVYLVRKKCFAPDGHLLLPLS